MKTLAVGSKLVKDGKVWQIVAVHPPHRAGTSGKISVTPPGSDFSQMFYVTVFNLEFNAMGELVVKNG